MDNLVCSYEDNMLRNTQLYGGVIYSQKVLLKLVEQGYTREDTYKIVQKHALDALNGGNFKSNFTGMDKCFDEKDYLKNIDGVFKRFNGEQCER